MKLRSGARVERAIEINPEAMKAFAQQNASTPLLRLPLEVKNLIYKLAFGGHLIHIDEHHDLGDQKLENNICRAVISEEEAQEDFESETISQWNAPTVEFRHGCCYRRGGHVYDCCHLSEGMPSDEGEEEPEALRLGALRSCRQMYNEAHHIPYSTNVFSCRRAEQLQSFVWSLARGCTGNHLVVRSLFIEMIGESRALRLAWGKALLTCAKQLKGLQHVGFNIRYLWLWDLGPQNRAGWDEQRERGTGSMTSTLLTLRRLPLKSVTMVVSDTDYENGSQYSLDNFRWTLDKKQEWARYIKKYLLSDEIS